MQKAHLSKAQISESTRNKPCFIWRLTKPFIEALNSNIFETGNDLKRGFDARSETANRFISYFGPLSG
ncbi:hypothetical protein BN2476_640016 [Paraburkholderia piptadeniae]|uniref:Uncharacterized protein n=1 Tax=Paraburkholderia piptadeniae TaxID=1701573 RepID=A0A1N7SMC4_9BURK|nr:hypothetical protein BN2476_640016 [Paraburkholderia piptadeniae]